ncbi:UvrABC system protein B [Endomicrobiia bacterium]|uniref:excinuclease ABC subunit UvrB n=1 Tax=Endomicrobium trichonymphae TaxID=1408204 RepID=UPI000864E38B|nr:excinuclease ABC subunit UvrB [Candidatus Endomicrobium trichonymphae]BAV59053.1 UvrABC system protein B [Candidatus Endomicrobium trichonymphae]GHT24193.1 UvrABC system protein B [Endomicrobiia bacterium]
MKNEFKLISKFKPSGDQPQAIDKLYHNYLNNKNSQILLGVTGSGKTFVMASVIEKLQKPTLIISPNKILAAQTYAEFKAFFPNNSVEYFISYYDYYQPEAYIPSSDTYIEKDASINDHIDRLRLKATTSILERKDVIVVASVSCIYNLGSPKDYQNMCVEIIAGKEKTISLLLTELIASRYERNEVEFKRGKFRVKGDTVEIFPAYLETAVKIEFCGDTVERIKEFNPVTGEVISKKDKAYIYPAKLFVTDKYKVDKALKTIQIELNTRLEVLKSQNKFLEAQRLEQRTKYDIEMLKETGSCNGIENYSRHLSGGLSGAKPTTLIDYFVQENDDFLIITDESHISLPQIRGMYEGDRSRKQTLVDFGFRLPSALDNRPLKFQEFEKVIRKFMMVSATPGTYELNRSKKYIVDLIIRPTGLVDPEIVIRPISGQIQDLMQEIRKNVEKKQRTLVTTLTKKMSEDLAAYLKEKGIKVEYLHSEIDTLTRIEILKNLRLGKFDVLVGINLLREGLDLPEVSLVVVLDADKEGFLRSEPTLIQICGRAARNIDGRVIFYADTVTGSMQRALREMNRRRDKQLEHNKKNNIKPKSIIKAVHELDEFRNLSREESMNHIVAEEQLNYNITPKNIGNIIKEVELQMRESADNLDFESAAALRDRMLELKNMKSCKSSKR